MRGEGARRASLDGLAERVWDAMAKGAFKLLAGHLPVPAEACAPSTSGWTATIAAQCVRWFTALVVVWYVIAFAKAWLARVRQRRRG